MRLVLRLAGGQIYTYICILQEQSQERDKEVIFNIRHSLVTMLVEHNHIKLNLARLGLVNNEMDNSGFSPSNCIFCNSLFII